MIITRGILNTILATAGGSLAGGAAGGAALMLFGNLPDFSKSASVAGALGGLAVYVLGTFAMATLGAIGGAIIGFIPTLVLGSLLSLLRTLPPFQYVIVWASVGAMAGVTIYLWTPYGSPSLEHDKVAWLAAWALGGAASMSVYWAAFGRAFAPRMIAR